jgi:hypothetical protein
MVTDSVVTDHVTHELRNADAVDRAILPDN